MNAHHPTMAPITRCRNRLPTVALSHAQLIARGSDGHLSRAFERYIPLDALDGLEPVPSNTESADGRYHKGSPITQPIEVKFDGEANTFMVFSGNHRIAQARANGQSHIVAFVEPDTRFGIDYIGPLVRRDNPDTKIGSDAASYPEAVPNGADFGTLHHGTAQAFETFDATLRSGAGYHHQGRGFYLTSDAGGFARFFARTAAEHSMADEDSDGVILQVTLAPTAKILDMRGATVDPAIKLLLETSIEDRPRGARLQALVLKLGYDGLAFAEHNFPEGWQVDPQATTVVIYNPSVANIIGVRSIELPTIPQRLESTDDADDNRRTADLDRPRS